jgi:hypothetical protein
MSWQTRLAQSYSNMADWIENASIGINDALVDAGWTLLDELNATSGQTDRVYKSTGEDGTEAIYIRLKQVSGGQLLRFRLYTLWDATGHAGYNEVKNDDNWPMTISTLNSSFTGWIIANKNGLTLAWKIGSEYNVCYVGISDKRLVHAECAGRTTLTSGVTVTGAGSTNLAVADESNIQVGQKVRIIDQTVGANGGNFLRCTVTATAANQITVTNDAATDTDFDSGALVGYDPQPVFFLGITVTRTSYYGAKPAKGAMTIYGMDTLRMTGSAIAWGSLKQYASWCMLSTTTVGDPGNGNDYSSVWSGNAWTRDDPGVEGLFGVVPIVMVGGRSANADNSDECIRASFTRVAYVTRGPTNPVQEDVIQAGATAQWLCCFGGTDYNYNGHSTVFQIAE